MFIGGFRDVVACNARLTFIAFSWTRCACPGARHVRRRDPETKRVSDPKGRSIPTQRKTLRMSFRLDPQLELTKALQNFVGANSYVRFPIL